MSYTALYRKFRPDNFDDVKGQDHIVTTLTNQIKANRIGHAYLFCGTRGTGKTTVAKILAKAVNCQNPVNGSPCNECEMCRAIQAGTSMNVIEIDAASNNGVDNIREIREEVTYRPTEGNYKVYIIDEVHMLSTGAFNALLKTLEEPPRGEKAMSYTALYRKFRPDNFDDVKGQDHIVTTLTNQIKANRIGHAYLFCGTRGTGKTTVAKILAKAVNCQNPVNGSPCNECEMCRAIQAGTSMNVIEIDAASNNGVDNIREIREEVTYRPTEGNYKVYIIDEVHMLSTGAFNALLKTLEEPPSYVIFILATTEAHKIPITKLSRCQRYDFHRITIDTIAARLTELLEAEGVEAEEKAVRYVAKAGDGSMRDALSLLDQCIAFYLGQTLTYDKVLEVLGAVDTEVFSQLLRKVLSGDVTGSIHILEELITGGRELSQFVGDFTWYMRNLLLVKTSENPEDAIDVSSENLKLLKEESEMTDVDTLMRYIRIFSELSNQIRFATQKRVLVEIALIKLCRPAMETNLDSVLDRIRVLEQRMDEAPVQQVIVQQASGSAGEVNQSAVPEPKKPQKAAPEDLQKIVAGWKVIVGQTTAAFKQALLKSIPKYNGETGEPVLYVEFQTPLGRNYPDDSDACRELKEIIERQTGKSVELHMLVAEDHQQTNLSRITVDQAIRENIHMDVIIEEEPEGLSGE